MTANRIALACAALMLLGVPVPGLAWQAPDPSSLPDDAWGREVRYGRDLITDTPRLIGSEATDPAKRLEPSGLACSNCHLQAGTKEFGLPLVGVFGDFPQYRPREGRVGTLEERVNGCITRSLNGSPLPVDGPEMRAILSYLRFLSIGTPIGTSTPGRGAGTMKLLDRPADPVRGEAVFAQICAVCHGADGAGRMAADGAGRMAGGGAGREAAESAGQEAAEGAGRVGAGGAGREAADDIGPVPPLWGARSFNDGAGMNRLTVAANFIHANMPNGTDWHDPALSVEDAWDVAAFLISRPRPHAAGLEADFPVLRQKPIDAGYGPYADGFDQAQHRFGPFQPIEAARKAGLSTGGKPAKPDPAATTPPGPRAATP